MDNILLLLLNLYLFQFQNASGLRYLLVTVGNSLYFPGVEYIRQYVERAAKKQGGCSMPVVIDCRYVLGKLTLFEKTIVNKMEGTPRRGAPSNFGLFFQCVHFFRRRFHSSQRHLCAIELPVCARATASTVVAA